MELKGKMGSLAVVVIDVLPKNQLQVARDEDEQPVQVARNHGRSSSSLICLPKPGSAIGRAMRWTFCEPHQPGTSA